MKRIISILSAFFLTSNMFGGFIRVNANVDNLTPQEEFCFKMGIFSQDEYDRDKKLTRGDFTEVIANICEVETVKVEQSQWNELMYVDGTQGEKNVIFDDVDSVHPDYSTIKAVVEAGFMRGISDNLFGPELYITDAQVYKVLLDMIGYTKAAEMSGGYPAGYRAISSEQGIDQGVRADANGYLTYAELAKVIYNILDVNVMEFDYSNEASFIYQENDNKNFMNHVMGIDVIDGYLTDNGYTAIDGESEIEADSVKVGDVKVKISDDNSYMRNYIGQQVELYYRYDDRDEDNNEAVYMIPKKSQNEVITIKAENFISYTGNTIKYYNENGREKNIEEFLDNPNFMEFVKGDIKDLDTKNKYLSLVVCFYNPNLQY